MQVLQSTPEVTRPSSAMLSRPAGRDDPGRERSRTAILWSNVVKSTLDLAIAGVLLVLLAPVGIVVALAVLLSDPGPVFFRQERVGLSGRTFRIYKFRTMRRSAPGNKPVAIHDRNFKLPEDDVRVTRVGRFLRRTSLDEVPQLLNVLCRHMSVVGPRPVVAAELEHYGDQAHELLTVRPGITGLWQVSGRSEIEYPARTEFELAYVRNRALWLDLAILWRTVPAVTFRRGAW